MTSSMTVFIPKLKNSINCLLYSLKPSIYKTNEHPNGPFSLLHFLKDKIVFNGHVSLCEHMTLMTTFSTVNTRHVTLIFFKF